jgi:signal transduction histidine kinase
MVWMEDLKMPGTLIHRLPERIRWPRLPARTARLRLTALYGGLFLLGGVVLLGIVYLLFTQATGKPPQTGPGPIQGILTPRPPAAASALQAAQNPKGAKAALARQQIAWERDQLLIQSGIALGIMAVVAVALGRLAAGRVLRPLRTITVTARLISASSLRERLNLPGPDDELKELGDTLDDLFARLEAAFEAERRFVANASHELRTPLTMMRTALDVAECKPHPTGRDVILAAKMRRGLDMADRLLEGFLMLARAQNGSFQGGTTVSLGQLASAALAERGEAIAAMELTVSQAGQDAAVQGSEILLTRMVDNVIDNAVRHNEPAGSIRVTTEADGARARLVVETGGRMLDDREIRELARPFRRLAPDRTGSDNGTGLGLSIVAAVAATHHGTLDLHARQQGGLRVIIELPTAAPSAPAAMAAMAGLPS